MVVKTLVKRLGKKALKKVNGGKEPQSLAAQRSKRADRAQTKMAKMLLDAPKNIRKRGGQPYTQRDVNEMKEVIRAVMRMQSKRKKMN